MLISGKDACAPKARATSTGHCEEVAPAAWLELCTKDTPCTALPDGKLNTQKMALTANENQSKAAQAPGQSLAFRGVGNMGIMTVL